jgi:hypothetical protein
MPKPTAPAIAAELKYSVRFEAEKASQQKRYCDAFELWRSCRLKRCLRNRRCCGDANACLAKAVAFDRVPHRQAWRARQEILLATPRNIGALSARLGNACRSIFISSGANGHERHGSKFPSYPHARALTSRHAPS